MPTLSRDHAWVQVWVVDCADTRRLGDCKAEFEKLLQQERLAGSSLLVFANKQVRGMLQALVCLCQRLLLTPSVAGLARGTEQ